MNLLITGVALLLLTTIITIAIAAKPSKLNTIGIANCTVILVLSIILITCGIKTTQEDAYNKGQTEAIQPVKVITIEKPATLPLPTITPVIEAEPEPITTTEEPTADITETTNLGTFICTAYCACSKCCGKTDGITATGTKATANHTIAVDPKVIPYGSTVLINGIPYVAEDCGGAIKTKRIDVYFDTHEEALEYGVQEHEVLLLN